MKRGAPKSDPEKVRAFVERGRRSSADSLQRSSKTSGAATADARAPLSGNQPVGGRAFQEAPGTPTRRTRGSLKRSGFTPASKEQREKVEGEPCTVCCRNWEPDEGWIIDAAHLTARAQGGCDDALCVIPLCRPCHRAFDDGRLDIQPHIVGWYGPEIGHAAEHYNGDLIALLQRLTGCRWGPLEGGEGL